MSAACVDAIKAGEAEQAWWFPVGLNREIAQDTKRAKAICAACHIRGECLSQALRAESGQSYKQRHGIFGGMSPRERYNLADKGRTCEECGALFLADRDRKTCSGACEKVRAARYMREYQRVNRNNGKANPIARHGSTNMAHTGCTCNPCRGRRRNLQREARLRAKIRARDADGPTETANTGTTGVEAA